MISTILAHDAAFPVAPPKPGERVAAPTHRQLMRDRILDYIASGGSLARFCAENTDAPLPATVAQWEAKDPEFAAAMTAARRIKADVYIDQIIEIADSNIDPKRAKLMIETRWKLAGIYNREKYADDVGTLASAVAEAAQSRGSPLDKLDALLLKMDAGGGGREAGGSSVGEKETLHPNRIPISENHFPENFGENADIEISGKNSQTGNLIENFSQNSDIDENDEALELLQSAAAKRRQRLCDMLD